MVLSPLSDGSWKEVLVTYDLTEQEKQTILLGGAVNLAGKVTKELLQSGTYSSGIMNKGLADECFLMTYSYYTSCSENAHHHGEAADEDGGPCQAEIQSVLVVTSDLVCPNPGGSISNPGGNESGTTPGGFNPSGGGATTNPTDPSGSNGNNNPNQPCDGNGIPSQPQDPSSTLGNQPCNNGTVTLPNLPFSNPEDIIPCNKLKNLLDPTKANLKPLITGGMYDYINASSVGETGIYIRKDTKGKITNEVAPFTGTNSLPGKWGTSYYSEVHTHPKNVYPMFSYSDMMVLYNLEYQSYSYNRGHSSMLLVCEDDNGIKQTYAVVFENTGAPIENTLNNPNLNGKTQKEKLDALDDILNKMYDKELSKKTLDPSYKPNYERVFLQFCFGTNIGLYKADSNLINWSKLAISNNSDTATIASTNCN